MSSYLLSSIQSVECLFVHLGAAPSLLRLEVRACPEGVAGVGEGEDAVLPGLCQAVHNVHISCKHCNNQHLPFTLDRHILWRQCDKMYGLKPGATQEQP